jgi:hypothetical protein
MIRELRVAGVTYPLWLPASLLAMARKRLEKRSEN